METNEKILNKFGEDRERLLGELQELGIPEELQPLYEIYKTIDNNALVQKMEGQLKRDIDIWTNPEYTGANESQIFSRIGYSWYYDGSEEPEVMGFANKNKDIFFDCGGFCFGDFCPSLFDYVSEEGEYYLDEFAEEEFENQVTMLMDLFINNFMEILHLAWCSLEGTIEFDKLKKADTFEFAAHNEDDLQTMVFVWNKE